MRNTKCPTIINCNQIFKDVEIDKSSVNVQQLQICGSDPNMNEKLNTSPKYYR